MLKEIKTHHAPAAIGPYSQGIIANNLLFISGQLGWKPDAHNLEEGVIAQTQQSLKNIEAILQEAQASLHNVLKCTIFVKNMDDFGKINQVYSDFFGNHKPARATVEVARLPKDALVEIEAIALI